jgi:hypothetical protein
MADEEQRLLEEARRSREETEELREEGETVESEPGPSDAPREDEPSAKRSSGDADDVVGDDA